MDNDIRDDLHSKVDEVITAKEREDRREERLAAIEARVNTPQSPVDLAPVNSAIDSLSERLDAFFASLTANASTRSAETTASVAEDDPDDDDGNEETETAPKVITQMTTNEETEERAPRPSHFLFHRFGR